MEFFTQIYGVKLELKNNKLAIIIDEKIPGGTHTRRWVDVPKGIQKKLSSLVAAHFKVREEEAKMTPAQLAAKHVEYFT